MPRIEVFRFRSELRVVTVLNLALQLLDQFLQLGDKGGFFGHHRLLMLTAARSAESSNCIAAYRSKTSRIDKKQYPAGTPFRDKAVCPDYLDMLSITAAQSTRTILHAGKYQNIHM